MDHELRTKINELGHVPVLSPSGDDAPGPTGRRAYRAPGLSLMDTLASTTYHAARTMRPVEFIVVLE